MEMPKIEEREFGLSDDFKQQIESISDMEILRDLSTYMSVKISNIEEGIKLLEFDSEEHKLDLLILQELKDKFIYINDKINNK